MATFVYTGEEYINADHIISIDASPGQQPSGSGWIPATNMPEAQSI